MKISNAQAHDAPGALGMLEACHARIRGFAQLAGGLSTARNASRAALSEGAAALLRYVSTAFVLHAGDEDQLIAPLVHGRGLDGDAEGALRRLPSEHHQLDDRLAGLMPAWRALAEDPSPRVMVGPSLAALSATFRAEVLAHMALEESALYPALRRAISPDEDAELVAAMRARRIGARTTHEKRNLP